MRLEGTAQGSTGGQGGRRGGGGTEETVEEEEEAEEERGVSGQPGSSRATRRKPRYHPPSTPHLLSSKRPCHTPPFPAEPPPPLPLFHPLRLPPAPLRLPPAPALLRVLSKPPPRFHLRFLLAARATRRDDG
jgi:hypothetical protein